MKKIIFIFLLIVTVQNTYGSNKAKVRIVTLSPSLTEIVWDILPKNKKSALVGVSSFSDFPKSVKKITKVGSYIEPKLEKIVSLKPTLVLSTKRGNPKGKIEKLISMGLNVKVTHIKNLQDLIEIYKKIGQWIGEKDIAIKKSEKIMAASQEIAASAKSIQSNIKVYYQLGHKPAYTINSETFTSHLLELAGGKNIFEKSATRYPKPKTEVILSRNPDIIFISDFSNKNSKKKEIKRFWKNLESTKTSFNDQIHIVDSSLTDRIGPRSIEALKYFHEKIKILANSRGRN